MTIQTLIHNHAGEYDHLEVYKRKNFTCRQFTSYDCTLTDDYNENTQVRFFELMDEARYNEAFQKRKKLPYDFMQLYGDHNVKVLCIMT